MALLVLAQGLLSAHKSSFVGNNKGLSMKVGGWVPNSTIIQSL